MCRLKALIVQGDRFEDYDDLLAVARALGVNIVISEVPNSVKVVAKPQK